MDPNETRIPWFGVLAPEGVPSGDKRMFSKGALRMRPGPLPLTWQKITSPGHDNAVTVATIEKVWRHNDMVWGSGFMLDTPEANEFIGILAAFGRYGVSIDADDLDEFAIEIHEDGLTEFTDARACSACAVSIPAFAEAWIMLGEFSEDFAGGWGAPSQPIPDMETETPEEDDGECSCDPEDPAYTEDCECDDDVPEEDPFSGETVEAKDYTPEQRDDMAGDEAMPDGSYPIADCEDLRNAIQAIGRAKDPEAVKSHIRSRKNALGCDDVDLPDTWALFAPGTQDGPGWLTHPVDTDRLRDYWVRGEGAAKIAWGTPGDFDRCRTNLAKYVKPQYLNGYCANRHFDALGFWPGEHHGVADDAVLTLAALPEREIPEQSMDRGPGWVTHPEETARLHRYWTSPGEAGYNAVNWFSPGAFDRCRTLVGDKMAEHSPDVLPHLNATCARWYYDTTGIWPGRYPGQNAGEGITMTEDNLLVPAETLVASGPRADLPGAWFTDPGLPGPTALNIEGDRLFGHLATWGVCHIGIKGDCTETPHSATDYAYFRTGMIQTDTGPVYVGNVTMGGGHADARLGWIPAVEHYDSTSAVIADVACGEDAHGVWVAGAIRPHVTDEQRAELLASGGLSGDWREVRRGSKQLELVAALAVNVGGFPVPRLSLAASGGYVTALTAAGIVTHGDDPIEDVADAVAERLEQRAEIKARMEKMRSDEVSRRLSVLREGV